MITPAETEKKENSEEDERTRTCKRIREFGSSPLVIVPSNIFALTTVDSLQLQTANMRGVSLVSFKKIKGMHTRRLAVRFFLIPHGATSGSHCKVREGHSSS